MSAARPVVSLLPAVGLLAALSVPSARALAQPLVPLPASPASTPAEPPPPVPPPQPPAVTPAAPTGARPAHVKVAMIDLRADAANPLLAPLLTQQFADRLRRDGLELLPPQRVAQRMADAGAMPGCIVGPCLQPYGAPLGTALGLDLAIAQSGNSYRTVATLVRLDGDGAPLDQVVESCDVCEIKEGMESVARAADRVAQLACRHETDPPPGVRVAPAPPLASAPVRLMLLGAGIALASLGAALAARPHGALIGGISIGAGGLLFGAGGALILAAPPEEAGPSPSP